MKQAARADQAGEPRNPWRLLRRQQDRRRYLRVLAPRGGRGAKRSDPAAGIPRASHPLLGPPASMTRTATHAPDPRDVKAYVRHSCDLTMRGGVASAMVYPLAVCALAEHYVIRRVAGSSAGAVTAAATVAAELGRAAPDPAAPPRRPAVTPGFAGLAELIGWLAGDATPPPGASTAASRDGGPAVPRREQWRLARMIQPSAETRAAYRVLAGLLWSRHRGGRVPARRLLPALLGPPGWAPKLVAWLLWLGFGLAWLGTSMTLLRDARAEDTSVLTAATTSFAILVGFAIAAAFATGLTYGLAMLRLVRGGAEDNYYGLVSGVEVPGRRRQWAADWLDRRCGLPAPAGMPPLVSWLADRLDDLAGVPARDRDRALTFGDLWLGHTDERSMADADLLRRACADPELRVIDLVLAATNLSQRRPYRLPFAPAEAGPAAGRQAFLFCEVCLEAVLPQRVVVQMVKSSPGAETEHRCPRHRDGVLRGLPDPWDLPVIAAVRMSMATPGLIRAVPLYSIDTVRPGPRYDEWGGVVEEAPSRFAPTTRRVHVHWFCDGAAGGDVGVQAFDSLLPRWPTFGFSLEHDVEGSSREALRLPEQDAARPRWSWHPVSGVAGFTGALLGSALGWPDRLQSGAPGFRGRVVQIRHPGGMAGFGLFMPQERILRLAMHGLHAGAALLDRFLAEDGGAPGQTRTDRYRWIRMRMALREYRRMSLDIAARLPLYSDLTSSYQVPPELAGWFARPPEPGDLDPAGTDAAAVWTTLRAMSVGGGVLDFDAGDGAPPDEPTLRLLPPE